MTVSVRTDPELARVFDAFAGHEVVADSGLGVLTVLLPHIGYPRTLNGLAALEEIAPFRPEDSA